MSGLPYLIFKLAARVLEHIINYLSLGNQISGTAKSKTGFLLGKLRERIPKPYISDNYSLLLLSYHRTVNTCFI